MYYKKIVHYKSINLSWNLKKLSRKAPIFTVLCAEPNFVLLKPEQTYVLLALLPKIL